MSLYDFGNMEEECDGLACQALRGGTPKPGKLNFSTNGLYGMGKANIPTIIFAAGDETTAHGVNDQGPLDDLVRATEFYALLPALLKCVADRLD